MSARYQIPKEPGKKSAILLAALMHVLLFLFLWIGIRWQNKEPVGVDAEIWDINTRQAAPKPVAETPPPPPPEPEIKKPEPKQIEEQQEAEIALERAREKKRIEQKRLEEKLKLEDQKKQEQAKIEEQKKAEAKAEALAQKQRMENLRRLTSQVGGRGDAVKSTGNNRVDPSYAGRIAAKIKSNMVYVDSENGSENPTAEFRINLFPDGSLRGSPTKTKSSGVAAFDDAVERAIIKSAPYPADKSGNIPSTIPLTYRLKD